MDLVKYIYTSYIRMCVYTCTHMLIITYTYIYINYYNMEDEKMF